MFFFVFALCMVWIVLQSARSLNFSAFSLMKSWFVGSLLAVLFTILIALF